MEQWGRNSAYVIRGWAIIEHLAKEPGLSVTFKLVLELLSLLCIFENSTKCSKVSFDSDYFSG